MSKPKLGVCDMFMTWPHQKDRRAKDAPCMNWRPSTNSDQNVSASFVRLSENKILCPRCGKIAELEEELPNDSPLAP